MKRFIEATAAMLAWAVGILAVRYCENPWLVAAGVLTNYCASVLRWKYLEMPECIVTVRHIRACAGTHAMMRTTESQENPESPKE